MAMMNKNVPQIRFPGFNDAWVQRKLSDLVNVNSGRDYKHLSEGDIPVYGTGGYMLSVDEALSYDRDAIGIGRKGTIDNPYILRAPFWTVDTLFYAIPQQSESLDFVYDLFQTIDWKKKDESTGVPSLSKVAINDTDVKVPSIDEQKKIGELFAGLDSTITLHQRKCDETKELKQAMLQKMFPKEGEKTPEIRFPGFTEDWEQRKLLDYLIQPISDGPHETPLLVEEGIPFISVDAIVDNHIDFSRKRGNITEEYDLECRKKYSPQKNDVYLVKSGATVGKVAIVDTDIRFNIWSPLAAMRTDSEKMNPQYLYYILQTKRIQNEVVEKSKGGTQPNLSMRVLEKFEVNAPSLDEQLKISNFLLTLDNAITLHQRKCDSLKELKKALLQKMFA